MATYTLEEQMKLLGEPDKEEETLSLTGADLTEDEAKALGLFDEPAENIVPESKVIDPEEEETPTMFQPRTFDEGPAPSSLDAQGGMATTSESIYYGGKEGQKMKYREGELRSALADEFLFETTSQEEVDAMKKELEEIEAKKQAQFDKISGENVTDMGPLGKIISNDDGSKNYVPGPSVNEAAQLPIKFLSDTARGVLGLPELLGLEGYQDIIPKVASDDEAVVVVSELAQLTVGGLGGLTAAERLKKINKLSEYFPNIDKFLAPVVDKLGKAKAATTVKGTLSTSLGAGAVADEDIQTFFGGDKEMTMAEAKLHAMTESIAIGMALRGLSYAGNALSAIPGVRSLASGIAKTITMMMTKGEKLDDKVIESLAERLNESHNVLTAAKTPEEILAAEQAMFDIIDEGMKLRTGMNVEEFIQASSKGEVPEGTYIPTIGEVLNDAQLLRMYTGIRLSASKDKAMQAMSQMFKVNEDKRLQAIVEQGEKLVAQQAPEGREAAELARLNAKEALEEQTASIEKQLGERTADIEAKTDVGLARAEEQRQARLAQLEGQTEQQVADVEAQTAKALAEEEAKVAATRAEQEAAMTQAEAAKAEAQRTVQQTMESSTVSPMRLDDLMNQIDENGIVKPISDGLRNDLKTKDALAENLKSEYNKVEVDYEDLADLLESITAKANVSKFIDAEAVRDAYRPVRRLVRAIIDRAPEEPIVEGAEQAVKSAGDDILEEIKRLEKLLAEETDPVASLKIAKQLADLVRKGGKGKKPTTPTEPTTPVGPGTPAPTPVAPEAPDLPAITAADLLEIKRLVSAQGNDLVARSAQTSLGSAERNQLGNYLKNVGGDIDSLIAARTEGNEAAIAARDEFETFFKDVFSERWRSETGRAFQSNLFDPMNEADMAAATERMLKVVTNPKATEESLVTIRNWMSTMDEATKIRFAQDIAPRVAYDFATKNKSALMPGGDSIKSVAEAERALRAIDLYMSGAGKYFDMLPEAASTLLEVRAGLQKVVDAAKPTIAGAEQTVTASKQAIAEAERAARLASAEAQRAGRQATREAETAGRQAERTIETEAKETVRALNKVQQEGIAEVELAMRKAQRRLDRSAFARLTDFDGEPADYFARVLNDTKRGMADIEALWERAGKQGLPDENGLTSGQRAIKEAVAEALISKAQTSVATATQSGQVALAPLLDAVADKGTVANKVFTFVFQGDEAGEEMFKRYAKAAASFRQTQAMKGVVGSPTAEKMAAEAALMDLNRVIFGPLTKKARIANFITKVSMRMFGTEAKVAEAYARIMTDPSYSKRIVEKAAEMRKMGMATEEEATGKAFLSVYMSALGFKEYEKATDPWLTLEEHYKSFSTGAETEEAFSQ